MGVEGVGGGGGGDGGTWTVRRSAKWDSYIVM